MYEKVVVITRKTRLEELVARFNSIGQARFYIEHSGGDFTDYERENDRYKEAIEFIRARLHRLPDIKVQFMDRSFLSAYLFSDRDAILAVGQDGLVANTAKYVGTQPIIAINPDPERFDGILLPFKTAELPAALDAVLSNRAACRNVTLGQAVTNDGQKLLAFNDFFIGARSHISALYRIETSGKSETQSSSGIIVSTGAGSTGWLSSVFNMANGVAAFSGGQAGSAVRLDWDTKRLMFAVREPFASRHSCASIIMGDADREHPLVVRSLMPANGVIFSDGMEADFIQFNSGSAVTITPAAVQARLVVK
jgi:NAD kinase